ncbi:MAG: isoprenylcysteine carboxylmethyltransferase family protein [Alphaproteobacteria bacterium]|nr:MAG: isoprenylcysteine carboxylmethyltransferase family protein [Alphaproteobacteria bacterium]
MGRLLVLCYGLVAYFIFFLTFLYAIGFVGNIFVAKTVDSGAEGPLAMSIIINLLALSVFAIQHTIMARPKFKAWFTKVIPAAAERSTFVLLSSLALILIYWAWQPMLGVVWNVQGTLLGTLLTVLFWFGWLTVLTSTFLINHFDLFGLSQIYANFTKKEFKPTGFRKILFYKLVRHPIMTGFIIAFWSTPMMSTGHLLFSAVTTVYIYIGVKYFEEKDLRSELGEIYHEYAKEVGAFIPGLGKDK